MEPEEIQSILELATKITCASDKIEIDVDQLYNLGLYFGRFVSKEGVINIPVVKFFIAKTNYRRIAPSDQLIILVCAIKVQLKIGEYKGFEYEVIAKYLELEPSEVSSFMYRVVDICNGSIY